VLTRKSMRHVTSIIHVTSFQGAYRGWILYQPTQN
jgi:hypothetical protein